MILEISFHFRSLSSWLVDITFAWEILFILLTLFSLRPGNFECLSFVESLILSIWPWKYLNWYFCYVLLNYFLGFLCFHEFAFVWFLLLSKDSFLLSSHFSLTAIDYQRINIWLLVCYTLSCSLYMGSKDCKLSTMVINRFKQEVNTPTWNESFKNRARSSSMTLFPPNIFVISA